MYKKIEGQKAPSVTFNIRHDDKWVNITSKDIFSGKKVIIFGLPGAYTPTCSSSHLPRYEELYEVFARHGVDDIYCLSVNDTFVLNAWAADEKIKKIKMLPDGNAEFTQKMGLIFNAEELGFGQRSWRYSMLIDDGIIQKQFIEPIEPNDPFKVSNAETMLNYIAPMVTIPQSVTLFTKPGCPFCAKAKQILHDQHITFEEIVMGKDATITSLKAVSGQDTVPQVFIGGQRIGSSNELEEWITGKNKYNEPINIS